MKVLSSHDSALDYWHNHFSPDMEIGDPAQLSPNESFACTKDDVLGCYPELYIDSEKPLHILVLDNRKRRPSKHVICHAWTTDLPEGAFHGKGSFYVSSPEFVFLQMASQLTIVQLIALGCELCGTYILQPKATLLPNAFDEYPTRVAPLTSIEKIDALLKSAGPARGKKKAQRALKYVVESSRSPMETRTYMQLCLPPMLGGYGLPKAELNPSIELDDEAKRIAARNSCYGDICWPAKKLDVEYHGEIHVGADKMKQDVGRTLGIEHMGWRVITVTSPQVFDIGKFETVAKEAASHMKVRLYPRVLGKTPARMALHDELDAWMSRV